MAADESSYWSRAASRWIYANIRSDVLLELESYGGPFRLHLGLPNNREGPHAAPCRFGERYTMLDAEEAFSVYDHPFSAFHRGSRLTSTRDLDSGLMGDRLARALLWRQLVHVPPFRALVRCVEGALFREICGTSGPALDVGCGDGDFAATSFESPPYLGMDPDRAALTMAAERGGYENLVQGRGERIPLSDDRMETVVAVSVCEHIANVGQVIAEVHRVLRPGGRFVLSVPSPFFADMLLGSTLLRAAGAQGLARRYGDWFNRLSRHVHVDPPEVWCERLRAAGFAVEFHRYFLTSGAMRAFDLCHYLSIPMMLTRWLTGRWVACPRVAFNRLHYYWLKRWVATAAVERGPYLILSARKAAQPPLSAEGAG